MAANAPMDGNSHRSTGLRASLLLAIWLLGLPSLAFSQSGRSTAEEAPRSTSQDKNDDVLRIKTDEVLLPVSVRDETGTPVSGLEAERFIVFDNGVRQEIASFNRERVPANIVLLLDASSSVFSQMRFIRAAAKRFVEGLLKEDKVSVVQFSDQVELLQDWTPATNLKAIEKSLNWRYRPGMRTVFYDGLYLAAETQLRKVEGRRIVILLTDGLDTAERKRASFEDALNATRRQEAAVYVVSLTANLRSELQDKSGKSKLRRLFSGYDQREVARYLAMIDASEERLEKLATQTGGRLFLPLKDDDLLPAYQAIAEELRTQYLITYKPKPRTNAGEFRKVRVLVIDGPFEVATREGYSVEN